MSILRRAPRGSIASHWDRLRESYWFLPTLMVAFSAGLALGLVELDRHIAGWQARRLPWIQDAGPEGTRALLSTVAGSMITVTGVVFSITIVALTLASSQFGPRLLRNFLRDRGNQLVLGTFVSTFLYSLLVLRAVDGEEVPYLATAGALALAIASIFVLIFFVHHAASSIQASSVIAGVAREIDLGLPSLFPERLGRELPETGDRGADAVARLSADAREVSAKCSGYVRVLDTEALLSFAVERDVLVELAHRPGDFVAEGDLLARAGPSSRLDDGAVEQLRGCFVIGAHRTAVQDIVFLTDQLAEMAVRALSPGVNDPNTAVACVHRLGAVLAQVVDRKMPSPLRADANGTPRVAASSTTFDDIVASCLDPVRRYGGQDARVVTATLSALRGAILRSAHAGRRELLLEHAHEWAAEFARCSSASKRDRTEVDAALGGVQRAAERMDLPIG